MSDSKKDNVVEMKKSEQKQPKITREQQAFMNICHLAQMGLQNECGVVGAALERLANQDDK